MSVVLSTLFTSPRDLWDYLSVEGVDLREDDHNLASGQIIQTTADAAVGVTTLSVLALPIALLRGDELKFDSSGLTAPVRVQLTAAAPVGSTSISINQVTTVNGVDTAAATTDSIPSGAQARHSGVNAATGARLLVGCRRGTSKVKLYCNARYDDSQLALSGTVQDWATVSAAKFLCTRRAQGCPKSIKEEYIEAMEEMRMVQSGALSIESIGTRGVDWPTMVNITVNPAYDIHRARVQPSMSEQTPTGYGQFIDWNSAASLGL